MKRIAAVLGVLVLFVMNSPVQAATFAIEFTADQFGLGEFDGLTPPADTVSGTITYQAASLGANIDSLTSVSLTIAGHSFTLAEIGYLSPLFVGGDEDQIGGTINGVDGIINVGGVATDDFRLDWRPSTATGNQFTYSATGTNDTFESDHFSHGAVAELVGNEGGVVSGVFNLESSGVEAPDWRPRHDEHYHEA